MLQAFFFGRRPVMEERASRFRAEVALLNAGREGRRRFSEDLRVEALDYLSVRRKQGASFGQITLELGLGSSTLENWRRKQKRFRRVVARDRATASVPSVSENGVIVQTISGLRIAGLAMSEVIELVKALA